MRDSVLFWMLNGEFYFFRKINSNCCSHYEWKIIANTLLVPVACMNIKINFYLNDFILKSHQIMKFIKNVQAYN